jgi:hypothetical protein
MARLSEQVMAEVFPGGPNPDRRNETEADYIRRFLVSIVEQVRGLERELRAEQAQGYGDSRIGKALADWSNHLGTIGDSLAVFARGKREGAK